MSDSKIVETTVSSVASALHQLLGHPVTMASAQRLDESGFHEVAAIARKYAVDRPRWWHRFRRRAA